MEERTLAYTVEQAALATGRSKTRIKKAIREGDLSAIADGRATIIMRVALEQWLAALPRRNAERVTAEKHDG